MEIELAILVTHIGGMNAVIDTTLELPNIPGGKKLIYTHIDMPLTAIADFRGKEGEAWQALADICEKNHGLWSVEAEKYLFWPTPITELRKHHGFSRYPRKQPSSRGPVAASEKPALVPWPKKGSISFFMAVMRKPLDALNSELSEGQDRRDLRLRFRRGGRRFRIGQGCGAIRKAISIFLSITPAWP